MGKKRQHNIADSYAKRARISTADLENSPTHAECSVPDGATSIHIQQKDKVERKVDLIIKDTQNNSYRSLSIWGTGFGVEKTIAVVEELKRNYIEQGTTFSQETSIKTSDNNEPHLQVVLTILSTSTGNNSNT